MKTHEEWVREIPNEVLSKYQLMGEYEGCNAPIIVRCKLCGEVLPSRLPKSIKRLLPHKCIDAVFPKKASEVIERYRHVIRENIHIDLPKDDVFRGFKSMFTFYCDVHDIVDTRPFSTITQGAGCRKCGRTSVEKMQNTLDKLAHSRRIGGKLSPKLSYTILTKKANSYEDILTVRHNYCGCSFEITFQELRKYYSSTQCPTCSKHGKWGERDINTLRNMEELLFDSLF